MSLQIKLKSHFVVQLMVIERPNPTRFKIPFKLFFGMHTLFMAMDTHYVRIPLFACHPLFLKVQTSQYLQYTILNGLKWLHSIVGESERGVREV